MQTRVGVSHPGRIIEGYFWLLAVLGLIMARNLSALSDAQFQVTAAAGVAVTVFGLRTFIGHGKGRITALGLFNLSTALFVGFGAVYAATTQESLAPANYLFLATMAVFIPQLAITAFCWGKAGLVEPQFPESGTNSWLHRTGFLVLVVAAGARLIGVPQDIAPYVEATAFAAISVIAVAVFWRERARLVSFATFYVGALVILYAEVFHIGSGRLRIVALVCTVGVIISARFQRKALKWFAVAAIGPALWWLARDRKELQESLNAGASAGRNGLESMLEPIQVFARLIQAHQEGGFPLSYGVNLLSYPSVFIDSWFPDVPQALGYELVRITAPERYGSGYSVVATSSGEAYFNFGFLGLVLMVPVLVYLLTLLDRKMVNQMSRPTLGAGALLWIVFWAMLAGGISDLTWSGQHTFFTRATTRLPLLGLLGGLAWMHGKLASKSQPARRKHYVQAARR